MDERERERRRNRNDEVAFCFEENLVFFFLFGDLFLVTSRRWGKYCFEAFLDFVIGKPGGEARLRQTSMIQAKGRMTKARKQMIVNDEAKWYDGRGQRGA